MWSTEVLPCHAQTLPPMSSMQSPKLCVLHVHIQCVRGVSLKPKDEAITWYAMYVYHIYIESS